MRERLGKDLYDLNVQLQFQSKLARVHTFYSHPPFEALIFAPFTFVSYQSAYAFWTIFSVGLLIGSLWLIESATRITQALSRYLRIPVDGGLVLVLFATFSPVMTCLLIGQDSLLLLLVFSLVYGLMKRKSEFLAGCVLACGLFKFQFVVPFALVLLFLRRWQVLKGFTIVGVLLFVVSLAIAGVGALSSYPRLLFQEKLFQQLGDLAYVPNIRGFLHLILGEHAGLAFPVIVFLCSVVTMWIAARNWRDDQLPLSFSGALLATLLASYHLYTYDLSLLLLPISLLCAELGWGEIPTSWKRGRFLLFASATLLFIQPLHLWLIVHRLYVLMVIPITCLLIVTLQLIHYKARAQTAPVKA